MDHFALLLWEWKASCSHPKGLEPVPWDGVVKGLEAVPLDRVVQRYTVRVMKLKVHWRLNLVP